jgi:hypothetical protein
MTFPGFTTTSEGARRVLSVASIVWRMRWARVAILCLPIVAYYFPLLLTGNKTAPGDPDYYFALYEGFRKTVLDYHQFPWWDPWIAGGVPLFGNVQFGLIGVSAPLVLVFGTVFGLKLSLLFYGIIAFFGARRLIHRYFQASEVRSIALAYVFTFSGYFAARAYMGHFTFPLVAYSPWVIYYYLYIQEKHAWVKFSLVLALFIDTAPHYPAIMTLDILVLLFTIETAKALLRKRRTSALANFKNRSKMFLRAGTLLLLLVGYRMYYVLDFFKDHQRTLDVATEKFTTVQNGFLAMWWYPDFSTAPARRLIWSWGEIETYIGIGTFFAICLITIASFHNRKKIRAQFSRPVLALLGLFVIFFSLGMGDFGRFSPYLIAQKLPLFSAMRVATRWIFWDSCIVLLFIAAYKGKMFSRTITILCVIAAVELFIRYPILISEAYSFPVQQHRSATASFYQEKYYHVPRPEFDGSAILAKKYWSDRNLLEATDDNVGEPFASDSLLYKTFFGKTWRCEYTDNRKPCPFVVSKNASVSYWSPNEIKLVRTGPGPIDIDMNPGKGWRINGTYPFGGDGSVKAEAYFKFGYANQQKTYDIVYAPKFSFKWVTWELNRLRHKL